MNVLDVIAVGLDYVYRWPSGNEESYPHWVEYRAAAPDGEHRVRLGFGLRPAYGRERKRLVVWIDGHPQAELLGADDFEHSGQVLSEIKVPGRTGERICRYPEEPVPERYSSLPAVGLPTRISGPGVRSAWAIVASVAEHRAMVALAALRRIERNR